MACNQRYLGYHSSKFHPYRQREEERRRKKEEKESKKQRGKEGKDTVRIAEDARQKDAQAAAARERRKSFNNGTLSSGSAIIGQYPTAGAFSSGTTGTGYPTLSSPYVQPGMAGYPTGYPSAPPLSTAPSNSSTTSGGGYTPTSPYNMYSNVASPNPPQANLAAVATTPATYPVPLANVPVTNPRSRRHSVNAATAELEKQMAEMALRQQINAVAAGAPGSAAISAPPPVIPPPAGTPLIRPQKYVSSVPIVPGGASSSYVPAFMPQPGSPFPSAFNGYNPGAAGTTPAGYPSFGATSFGAQASALTSGGNSPNQKPGELPSAFPGSAYTATSTATSNPASPLVYPKGHVLEGFQIQQYPGQASQQPQSGLPRPKSSHSQGHGQQSPGGPQQSVPLSPITSGPAGNVPQNYLSMTGGMLYGASGNMMFPQATSGGPSAVASPKMSRSPSSSSTKAPTGILVNGTNSRIAQPALIAATISVATTGGQLLPPEGFEREPNKFVPYQWFEPTAIIAMQKILAILPSLPQFLGGHDVLESDWTRFVQVSYLRPAWDPSSILSNHSRLGSPQSVGQASPHARVRMGKTPPPAHPRQGHP